MGKKMKLPFISHSKSLDPKLLSSQPWPWPACGNLKTLSFRDNLSKDDAFRTYNSAFLDTEMTPPESFFTVSSSSLSFSTMSEDSGDPVESVIRGLRSDRLFFEPDCSSSLALRPCNANELEVHEEEQPEQQEPSKSSAAQHGEEQQEEQEVPRKNAVAERWPQQEVPSNSPSVEGTFECEEKVVYKESEIMLMDSNNPYEDFKKSMEEMVEAHDLKDWQGLEELLGCYLKINGKNNHGYIVGAFIDLLVSLPFTSSTTPTTPTSATISSSTTTTTTTSTSTSSLSSSVTNMNYSSPSSPLSLPSSSSLTTPCLSSLLDHDEGNDDDHDNDDGDDDTDHKYGSLSS